MKHNDYQKFMSEVDGVVLQEMTASEFADYAVKQIKQGILTTNFQQDTEGGHYGIAVASSPFDSYYASIDYYGGGQFRAIGLDSEEDTERNYLPTDYDLRDIREFIESYINEWHKFGYFGKTVFVPISDKEVE